MAKKPITISNFQRDTAPSAYLGFEEIRCLDTKNKPGSIYPSDALVKESASTIDDQIFATATDDSGNVYGITKENTNSVFKRTQAGVWSELADFTASAIYGIAFWEGHIILIHSDGTLDASDDDGASWTNAFDTVANNDGDTFPTIVAQDRKLYICCAGIVSSLTIGTDGAFDPTDADPTGWQLADNVLDLPPQYWIRSVVALGDDLMFGTRNNNDENDATIFPWDRVSPSFDQPIRLKENGVTYMIEVENLLYICAGVKGRWYVSNGSTVRFLSEIPKTLFDLTPINIDKTLNNAVAYNEGLIYFGVSYNNALAGNKLGVYSLDPKNGRINYAHIISTENIGDSTDGVLITSITKAIRTVSGVAKETIVVTWTDVNTPTYGADALTNTKYTGDVAFFTTQFLQAGTDAVNNSFNRPEIRLARKMVSGDSFKVYTREEQGASWTLLDSNDTVGFQQGIIAPISAFENIQFKVVLNGTAELLELRLI